MPHLETIACVEKARKLIEVGDADSLHYASLQLRMGMEFLFYELVPLYKEELPDDVLTKWQPQQILNALLECDPDVGKDSRMAVGVSDGPGLPLKVDTVFETKAPPIQMLKKHYHKLGSYLHAPVDLKNPSPEEWITYLGELISILAEYKRGQVLSNFRCLIDIECECGRTIKRNKRAIDSSGVMQCPDPKCRAVWDVHFEGDITHAKLRQDSFICHDCQTENFLNASKIKDKLRIDCVECGKKLLVRAAFRIIPLDELIPKGVKSAD
jgi:DNA-directed RNA polymerase subunit RPC12/RpoP